MNNTCSCGKKLSKNNGTGRCKSCHAARMAELEAKAEAVVATGLCPDCASALRRNLSLTGWWQCEQYGSDQFRKDAAKPACGFQTFTAEGR